MKIKKLIALGLATIMTVSALTACGNTANKEESKESSEVKKEETKVSEEVKESETTVVEEEITFPLAAPMEFTAATILSGDQYKMSDNYSWKKFEEYGNVHVEFTDYINSEASEKFGLALAGGEYPDFVMKLTSAAQVDKFGPQGVYIPLEDLIREYMPNLTKLLDERNGWATLTDADGHIYQLPQVTKQNASIGVDVWINKAWLDKLGLEEPTNPEELLDCLRAFKTEDPNGNGKADEIPISFAKDGSWYPLERYKTWFTGDGIHHSWNNSALIDGEIVFYPLTQNYKDNFLSFLAICADEGLLDPSGFTSSHEQLIAKVTEESVYGIGMTDPLVFVGNGANAEEYAKNVVFLESFGEKGGLGVGNGISKGAMSITDKCENPEVLCAWIDYLYSEEGGNLASCGIEGENYDLIDGMIKYKEDVNKLEYVFRATAACPSLVCGLVDNEYMDAEWKLVKRTEKDEALSGFAQPNMTFIYQGNEQQRVNDLTTEINAYVSMYVSQIASGEADLDATWDDFQKQLKAMGAEELQDIYKAAYARTQQ